MSHSCPGGKGEGEGREVRERCGYKKFLRAFEESLWLVSVYSYVLFKSQNGVSYFEKKLERKNREK